MRLYTTRRLVAALMSKYDLESKYALAKLMGVTQKAVSNWVNDGRSMNEIQAKKAADLLGLDYEFVLICLQYERSAKNPAAARAWSKVADLWDASKVAVFGILTLPFFGHLSPLSGLIS